MDVNHIDPSPIMSRRAIPVINPQSRQVHLTQESRSGRATRTSHITQIAAPGRNARALVTVIPAQVQPATVDEDVHMYDATNQPQQYFGDGSYYSMVR